MRLKSSLALWSLFLSALVAGQSQLSSSSSSSSSAAASATSAAASASSSTVFASSPSSASSLSPSAASSLSSILSVSSASLWANTTSSSSAAMASPSVLANGTTLYPNGTLATNETSLVLPYEIKLDGAYGVLGAVLVMTGAPVCLLGGKNRWTSLFLLYFYVGALIALVFALHFGVAITANPPSATMRGVFVLIGAVAGGLAGSVAVLIAKWAMYGLPFMGGFSLGWWLLAFKQGGLVKVLWARWVLLVGLATIAFTASLHPRLHNPLVVLSTSLVGSTALVLGIDCFSRAGLKELYVWNLGFRSIFDDVLEDRGGAFRFGDVAIVEIALIGICWIIGIAVQFRAWDHLLKPLPAFTRTERRRERDQRALDAERRVTRHDDELAAWEAAHGGGSIGKPDGAWPTKDVESPAMVERKDSGWGSTTGSASGREDMGGVPILRHGRQDSNQTLLNGDRQDLEQKEALLDEIQTIRRSIEALRSTNATPASPVDYLGLQSSLLPSTSPKQPVNYQRLSTLADVDEIERRKETSSRRPSGASATEWERYIDRRQIVQSPASPRHVQREKSGPADDCSSDSPARPPVPHRRSSTMDSPSGLGPSPHNQSPTTTTRPTTSRRLSQNELNDRHSRLMRKLQSPATESFAAEVARGEWETRRRAERVDQARREAEQDEHARRRAPRESTTTAARRKSSNVDVEGWRGSVLLDETKVKPPMGGPPPRRQSTAGQQA